MTAPSAPFPSYQIDPWTTREVVDDAAATSYLAAIADRGDPAARGERVGLLRMLGRLDEAEREGQAAYELARRAGTSRQRVAALIRLALVVQWRREWRRADTLFTEAIAQAEQLDEPLMLAFAQQHAGRNHVDQRRYEAAVVSFRAALALRKAHGAPADQLRSTSEALHAAEARAAGRAAADDRKASNRP